MFAAACGKGLALIGFSEHSPRPAGFDYTHEYRERLAKAMPDYISEVTQLKSRSGCRVLLGLEMDWLEGQTSFIKKAMSAHDYDYVIGSVHFLGNWGFDDSRELWDGASQEICEKRYVEYFRIWKHMLESGLFQIAAHPDLIKIYSRGQFQTWIGKPEALAIIRSCLISLRDSGMAMEISSAGLRKACQEFYPAPEIMSIAAELGLPVSMASDAHRTKDIACDFGELASYAASFGFREQTIFDHGKREILPF